MTNYKLYLIYQALQINKWYISFVNWLTGGKVDRDVSKAISEAIEKAKFTKLVLPGKEEVEITDLMQDAVNNLKFSEGGIISVDYGGKTWYKKVMLLEMKYNPIITNYILRAINDNINSTGFFVFFMLGLRASSGYVLPITKQGENFNHNVFYPERETLDYVVVKPNDLETFWRLKLTHKVRLKIDYKNFQGQFYPYDLYKIIKAHYYAYYPEGVVSGVDDAKHLANYTKNKGYTYLTMPPYVPFEKQIHFTGKWIVIDYPGLVSALEKQEIKITNAYKDKIKLTKLNKPVPLNHKIKELKQQIEANLVEIDDFYQAFEGDINKYIKPNNKITLNGTGTMEYEVWYETVHNLQIGFTSDIDFAGTRFKELYQDLFKIYQIDNKQAYYNVFSKYDEKTLGYLNLIYMSLKMLPITPYISLHRDRRHFIDILNPPGNIYFTGSLYPKLSYATVSPTYWNVSIDKILMFTQEQGNLIPFERIITFKDDYLIELEEKQSKQEQSKQEQSKQEQSEQEQINKQINMKLNELVKEYIYILTGFKPK